MVAEAVVLEAGEMAGAEMAGAIPAPMDMMLEGVGMVETGTERAEHKTRAVPGEATFLAVPQEVQGPSDLEETPPQETTPSPLAVGVAIMGEGAVLITAGAGAAALLTLVE